MSMRATELFTSGRSTLLVGEEELVVLLLCYVNIASTLWPDLFSSFQSSKQENSF